MGAEAARPQRPAVIRRFRGRDRVRLTPCVAALMLAALSAVAGTLLAQQAGRQPTRQAPVAAACRPSAPVPTRQPARSTWPALTDRLNQNTVTVISGNPNGTYLYLAFDMSAVLDDGNDLRVLPIIGKGGYQNVMDVLHLRGVDLCITQSNIMSYLKKTGEFGPNIDDAPRLHRQALQRGDAHPRRAGHQEHAGSQRQEGQLQRRRQRHAVLDPAHFRAARHQGAGGQLRSGRRLPAREVGRDRRHHPDRGQADGLVRQVQARARHDAAAGRLHGGARAGLLPGQADATRIIPTSIAKGSSVDTDCRRRGARRLQLARRTRTATAVSALFIDAFFAKFAEFQKPARHSKWRETNLAVDAAGLEAVSGRRGVAGEEPERHRPSSRAHPDRPGLARAQAARAAPDNPAEQERLFQPVHGVGQVAEAIAAAVVRRMHLVQEQAPRGRE